MIWSALLQMLFLFFQVRLCILTPSLGQWR